MKDKKAGIRHWLRFYHNVDDIKITRSGESYRVLINDVVTFQEVEKIEKTLQWFIGNIKDPKFNFLKAYNLHCSNVRFEKVINE